MLTITLTLPNGHPWAQYDAVPELMIVNPDEIPRDTIVFVTHAGTYHAEGDRLYSGEVAHG